MPYPQHMRIGIDARIVYYSAAGLGRYVSGLLGGLASIDQENEYTVYRSRKDQQACQLPPNFKLRRLWTPSHHAWEQASLPLELALSRMDVLHSPDFIPPWRRSYRSVITVHDLAFVRYPQFLTPDARRYYSQIGRAVNSADLIIAVSQSTRNDLVEMLGVPQGKVRVVYEAPSPQFRPLEADAAGAPDSVRALPRPFLLFVGTLEPRKNLPTLLRAMARIKAERRAPVPRLVVAGGKGWLYQEALDLIGHLDLGHDVVLFGPTTPQELLWLYNRAEMMVLPSFYEGFGLPVVEAMACGTPVVCSRASSLPEVAGTAALLVDPLDVDGLAGAICRVLDDRELRDSMRRAGMAQASRFDWPSTARATLAVYREAVS